MIHAGVKYNVIPGEATVDVDCRILPGTSEETMRATIIERIGPEDINTAYERMLRSDVKYRFVIDLEPLRQTTV